MFPKILPFKKAYLALTLAALGTMLLWIMAWVFIGLLSDDDSSSIQGLLVPLGPLAPTSFATAGMLYGVIQACVLAPIFEEIAFRWTFCAIGYDEKGKPRGNWSLALAVLGCAVLFGAAHGPRYGFSYEMILRMGMLGGILGVLYVTLKRRGASALVALACCAFAHGAYNFSVGTMQSVAQKSAIAGYKRGTEETVDKCKEFILKLVEAHNGSKTAPAAPTPTPPAPPSTDSVFGKDPPSFLIPPTK